MALRLLENSTGSKETRTYEITAHSRQLDKIEELFYLIEHMGSIGHSGCIHLFIDGDGSCRIKFDKTKKCSTEETYKYYTKGDEDDYNFQTAYNVGID